MDFRPGKLIKCRCGYSGGGTVHEDQGLLYLTCDRCGTSYEGIRELALLDAWNKRNSELVIFEFNVKRVYNNGDIKVCDYQVTGVNRDQALINLGREFTGSDYTVDIT